MLLITIWTIIQRRLEKKIAIKGRENGSVGTSAVRQLPDDFKPTVILPASDAPVVVDAQNVSKDFGGHTALHPTDLIVRRGEVVVVLGPSGSGKSTLLRTLNWIEPADQGDIRIEGESLPWQTRGGRRVRRGEASINRTRQRIGMVFQHFGLFKTYTARENVALGLIKLKKMKRAEALEKADSLLAQVGLAGQAHAFPVELSGGQRQRVAIARALSMDPIALLFDEPTSALDPETVNEVLDVMAALAGQGVTMVIVTHEVGFARRIADRLVFMEAGHKAMDMPVEQAFSEEAPQRFQAFLRHIGP